ncbi:hypothetical protein EU528_13425 [Candidatus Thorarchaeota archaeon]|nr:MAG: hypothetical protein EU528_13425 [Candidatus Thorarchaeota archaeon]
MRKETNGVIALEVMLLEGERGLSNIKGKPRKCRVEGIIDINPDLVQIYTPWRPGSVSTIRAVSKSVLIDFGKELESVIDSKKLWIYGLHDARGGNVRWKVHSDLIDDTLTLLKRRPCRVIDVSQSLGILPALALRTLDQLVEAGNISKEKIGESVFYKKR